MVKVLDLVELPLGAFKAHAGGIGHAAKDLGALALRQVFGRRNNL